MLSRTAQKKDVFRVKVHDMEFSLSGVQNKVEAYHQGDAAETAAYALRCLIGAIVEVTKNALKQYPDCQVVFAGGVASNALLREKCAALPAVFCPARYSTDNALGTAVLTWRAHHAATDL